VSSPAARLSMPRARPARKTHSALPRPGVTTPANAVRLGGLPKASQFCSIRTIAGIRANGLLAITVSSHRHQCTGSKTTASTCLRVGRLLCAIVSLSIPAMLQRREYRRYSGGTNNLPNAPRHENYTWRSCDAAFCQDYIDSSLFYRGLSFRAQKACPERSRMGGICLINVIPAKAGIQSSFFVILSTGKDLAS